MDGVGKFGGFEDGKELSYFANHNSTRDYLRDSMVLVRLRYVIV